MSYLEDHELIKLAEGCKSATDFCRKLGHKSHSTYTKVYRPRLIKLGIVFDAAHCKHTDLEFINAATGADSISDVCRRLGLQSTGGGYKSCKNRLKRLGIIVKTYTSNGYASTRKRPLSDYLVKNGPLINSSSLRKRLINEGLKANKCEECGIGPIWNSKPFSMQLDHIDGDNTNNELCNLRILCPICHVQTPTHSRVKRGKTFKNNCENCGKLTNRRFCSNKCHGQATTKIDWPDNLRELVDSSSCVAVARILGVSDKSVAKRLRNLKNAQ